MTENTPIISFKDADIMNGEATVIYSLDMDIYPSDFVYIVGKVGTGKTSIISLAGRKHRQPKTNKQKQHTPKREGNGVCCLCNICKEWSGLIYAVYKHSL